MGIVTTTAYPSRYVKEAALFKTAGMSQSTCEIDIGNLPTSSQVILPTTGKFHLRFNVVKAGGKPRQRDVAELLSQQLGIRALYQRKEAVYQIGDWVAFDGADSTVEISTGQFDASEMGGTLKALDKLQAAGYSPDDEITICFDPDMYDLKLITNLCNIMEARSSLIVKALGLTEEIRIIIDDHLAFGIPLNVFCFEKIEACVYLLRQASQMAASTGKARMKPCDDSNPKYSMRTWLLRLDFIGDEYARPRQTLLNGLTGDGAFFTDEEKEKANAKRRMKRAKAAEMAVSNIAMPQHFTAQEM